MTTKKCNWCESTTNASREDFDIFGWHGYMIKNKKMVCACPKHFKEITKQSMEDLLNEAKKMDEETREFIKYSMEITVAFAFGYVTHVLVLL